MSDILSKKVQKHQEYIDSLPVPTLAQIGEIAEKQEEKEKGVQEEYNQQLQEQHGQDNSGASEAQKRDQAASKIQRNYRGYKTRRELDGLSLDPSTRWVEAIKTAQYRNLTTPRQRPPLPDGASAHEKRVSLDAKHNWERVSKIARHAHGEPPEFKEDDENKHHSLPGKVVEKHKKHLEKKEREAWRGKMMDLPYFLEMVDIKHRYGSNLRAYHAEWKKSNTHENFFYWLDHGEGRNIEVPNVSRARLEREQVRYLSREERLQYLVTVDSEGRLCWHKNGQRIDTTQEYRDSVEGIVPIDSTAKTYREDEIKALQEKKLDGTVDSSDSSIANDSSGTSSSSEASLRYPDPPDLQKASGPKKIKHVSASVIFNRLLRKSTKKNTWIFVADTNMNLYVGIKQSGSFQHSSFLNGSRISAAGLIKVKRGQLRSLSPLSGHYRPPTAAFKHFIEHLREQNVDMSRVSISKAYAVLVGLEAYIGSKKQIHHAGDKVKHGIEHVVAPEKARERHEQEKDKSQSARLEEERLRELENQRGLNKVVRDVRNKVWGEEWQRPGSSKGAAVAPNEESTDGMVKAPSSLANIEEKATNIEEAEKEVLGQQISTAPAQKTASHTKDDARSEGIDALSGDTQVLPDRTVKKSVGKEDSVAV
jgi:hypothetical protein